MAPWLEAYVFVFFGFLLLVVADAVVEVVVDVDVGVEVEVDGVAVVVVVVEPCLPVVPLQAPSESPCARCAGTAGAAMLIVCSPPLPVL
jgi:hypothetical protein